MNKPTSGPATEIVNKISSTKVQTHSLSQGSEMPAANDGSIANQQDFENFTQNNLFHENQALNPQNKGLEAAPNNVEMYRMDLEQNHNFQDYENQQKSSLDHNYRNQYEIGSDFARQEAMDGHQVLQFLHSQEDQLIDFLPDKRPQELPDVIFEKPQVTRASILQDGLDIVKYLRLNRYSP